jgi:hypothetical protein
MENVDPTSFIQLGGILVPNNSVYRKLHEERLKEKYRREMEESEKNFLRELKNFGEHNIVFTKEPFLFRGYFEGIGIMAWDLESGGYIGEITDPLWRDSFNERIPYRFGINCNMGVKKHFLKNIFKNHPIAKEIYKNAQSGVYSIKNICFRGSRHQKGILESCVKRLPFL